MYYPPNDGRRHRIWRRTAAFAAAAGLVLLAGCGGSPARPAASGSSHGADGEGNQAAGTGSLGGLGHLNPAHEPAGSGSLSATADGSLFGGNAPLEKEERALGRNLAIVRVYYHIGQTFPSPSDARAIASGSTLLVSLDSVPGGGPSYASIIAGHQDATITAFLKAVNRAAIQYHLGAIYVDFEHEANDPRHLVLGSYSEFDMAWDHIHQLAESAHLDWNQGGRLHWVWILQHVAYAPRGPNRPWASTYWPGAAEVDVIAADGYNSYSCKVRKHGLANVAPDSDPDPAGLFNPVVSFADAHGGLPVFIAEWGVTASPPDVQMHFIQEMQAYVAGNREIAAAMYWDSGQTCNYRVNANPASVAALATMGRSPAMQGRIAADP